MINQDVMKGKWNEVKGTIKNAWGNLSSDELDKSQGDLDKITGMIQEKYGIKKEEARQKLNDVLARFNSSEGTETQTRH